MSAMLRRTNKGPKAAYHAALCQNSFVLGGEGKCEIT